LAEKNFFENAHVEDREDGRITLIWILGRYVPRSGIGSESCPMAGIVINGS
jgi:hypothetical protein